MAHAAHFSEQIAQMPVCYQPNDGKRIRPGQASRADHGLPADALVLCGFNQAYKISPEVLDVWCDLLHHLPGSVLWLLDWHGQARPNLLAQIERRGIAAERIVWAKRKSPADHVNRLQLADIFIDTWPTNAHTTASDALWAGVPLVTFLGRTFASRVAGSLLHAVGLDELVCDDVASYRQRVLDLAADPSRRAQLRARLVQARDGAALFDAERYAQDFEALLQRMQARHDAGLPPAPLPALPHAD
jgi:predicted O-linked N-acetylglucosamine transferase (SPINDLY family)